MKKININVSYVLSVHILALLIMLIQRTVLLLTNIQHIENVETKTGWIFSAFLRGVWFDNVIACYISILPLAVFCTTGLFNKVSKLAFNIFNIYYIVIYSFVFAIGCADIPYFDYFFKHLNTSIFNWNEEGGTTASMIMEESSYYIYMAFFIITVILFGYLIFMLSKSLTKKKQENIKRKEYLIYTPACLILIGLCIFGIRGRFGYNPIKTSKTYAFLQSNDFQLINPPLQVDR